MNKNQALEKIKKCLELGNSSNEHEAAQALKQAQILMKKYEMTEYDVKLSGISRHDAARTVALRLAAWQWDTAQLVAEIFGCGKCKVGNRMQFYGFGNRPQLAAYAFDVLFRQISAARRKFLKMCTIKRPSHREYLANCYCEGWLYGARRVVMEFAISEEERKMMDDYESDVLKVKEIQPRKIGVTLQMEKKGDLAMFLGSKDGKDVQLHSAMNGAEGLKQIGD